MRSHVPLVVFCLVLIISGFVSPVYGGELGYSTLSGGWSSPVGGPVADTYQSGFTLAASYRTPVDPHFLSGLEVGYTWLSLDSGSLENKNPGSTFSGGDLGFLSITTENDFLLGEPGGTARPFVNLGLGFYRSFADEVTETHNATASRYSTGVYEGSFFGFHGGVGLLIKRERFGVRLDANYSHLCQGGSDLEFFPVRAGIIFYPKG